MISSVPHHDAQLAPLRAAAIQTGANTVLHVLGNEEVIDCYWCRKVAALADGQLSLRQIAEKLYLPLQVAQKVATKGLKAGWLGLSQSDDLSAQLEKEIEQTLSPVLGEKGSELLERALRMTMLTPSELCPQNLPHVLIALELLLGEADRALLVAGLDQLRVQYAA